MVSDKGKFRQCGYKFSQKVGGDKSTGSLNFHFRHHHPAVVQAEWPTKYNEWLQAGQILSTGSEDAKKSGAIMRFMEPTAMR